MSVNDNKGNELNWTGFLKISHVAFFIPNIKTTDYMDYFITERVTIPSKPHQNIQFKFNFKDSNLTLVDESDLHNSNQSH